MKYSLLAVASVVLFWGSIQTHASTTCTQTTNWKICVTNSDKIEIFQKGALFRTFTKSDFETPIIHSIYFDWHQYNRNLSELKSAKVEISMLEHTPDLSFEAFVQTSVGEYRFHFELDSSKNIFVDPNNTRFTHGITAAGHSSEAEIGMLSVTYNGIKNVKQVLFDLEPYGVTSVGSANRILSKTFAIVYCQGFEEETIISNILSAKIKDLDSITLSFFTPSWGIPERELFYSFHL